MYKCLCYSKKSHDMLQKSINRKQIISILVSTTKVMTKHEIKIGQLT